MKTTDKIIIIDLEATCWDGPVPKDQASEVIEIGICMLDIHTGALTQNKGLLINPVYSSVSPFCTQLTTITQELLDREGCSFEEACTILHKGYNADQYTWASYGAYDLRMMQTQCKLRNVDFPLSQDHINVKELFAEKQRLKKRVGMSGALHLLDISLEGTHHRGIDDARNIGKILYWCLQQ